MTNLCNLCNFFVSLFNLLTFSIVASDTCGWGFKDFAIRIVGLSHLELPAFSASKPLVTKWVVVHCHGISWDAIHHWCLGIGLCWDPLVLLKSSFNSVFVDCITRFSGIVSFFGLIPGWMFATLLLVLSSFFLGTKSLNTPHRSSRDLKCCCFKWVCSSMGYTVHPKKSNG